MSIQNKLIKESEYPLESKSVSNKSSSIINYHPMEKLNGDFTLVVERNKSFFSNTSVYSLVKLKGNIITSKSLKEIHQKYDDFFGMKRFGGEGFF